METQERQTSGDLWQYYLRDSIQELVDCYPISNFLKLLASKGTIGVGILEANPPNVGGGSVKIRVIGECYDGQTEIHYLFKVGKATLDERGMLFRRLLRYYKPDNRASIETRARVIKALNLEMIGSTLMDATSGKTVNG